jgi:flagellar hook-associated protein 1 FlgK
MSAALNIGSRALNANLATLQVIGHNIANANTAGYSRQSVTMQTSGYQTLGGNYYGKGVEIGTVSRTHSAYLTRESQLATSVAAADSERFSRMQQLEGLFPIGEDGLGAAINNMLNAWSDVASSPTNLSARVVVLARAEDLSARLRDTAGEIDSLAYSGRMQLDSSVTSINRLAQDIAKVNQRIIENQGTTGEPNDLLDQRDALLGELSQYVQISTVAADDGSTSVFVAGSQPLVLGQRANSLTTVRDSVDTSRLHIGFVQGGTTQALDDASVGGQLGGLLSFLGQDLPQMQNLLGRMALALNTEMNTQHRLGVDLRGNAGADFFVPIALPDGFAATDNGGSGAVTVGVSDASSFKASDYETSFDGTNLSVVRLSDSAPRVPVTFSGLSGELDGLTFSYVRSPADVASNADVGDSFRVRPFADAARNMQVAVGAPDRLASASPVQVTPGANNAGGMSIEGLYAVSPSVYPIADVTLTFQADGSFTTSADPSTVYTYTPGKAIEINGWSLTLRGSPAAGDSFTIGAALPGSTPQNGGNAKAVLALRDQATFDGVSMADGYSSLLSVLGTQVQGAKFATNYSSQVASSAENARAAVSGVNLDEEAARLLQFQQSYQAAAKFLQVAQSTFDTLLQTVGR